jgi:hypothetical protein
MHQRVFIFKTTTTARTHYNECCTTSVTPKLVDLGPSKVSHQIRIAFVQRTGHLDFETCTRHPARMMSLENVANLITNDGVSSSPSSDNRSAAAINGPRTMPTNNYSDHQTFSGAPVTQNV